MEAAQKSSRLLGELFVEKGLLTEQELEDVLVEQRETGRRLGQIVVSRGLVSGPALTTALAEQLGIQLETERGFGSGLWAEIARRHERGLGDLSEPSAAPAAEPQEENAEESPPLGELEPTIAALAARLEAAEARFLAERAARERAEHELAQADARGDRSGQMPDAAFVLYVPLEGGFAVLERRGELPDAGDEIEIPDLGGTCFVVEELEASPIPLDTRRCAYLRPAGKPGGRRERRRRATGAADGAT